MKKILLFLFTILVSIGNYAQDRIKFDYDTAGNQTHRYICFNCEARSTNSTSKDVAELKDEDLLKFSQEDVLSYYPNPVKEQLYLKWELQNEVQVSHLTLFTLAGQQLRTISSLEKVNYTTVPFSDLPSGTYLILLNYTNGKQESITILKP